MPLTRIIPNAERRTDGVFPHDVRAAETAPVPVSYTIPHVSAFLRESVSLTRLFSRASGKGLLALLNHRQIGYIQAVIVFVPLAFSQRRLGNFFTVSF